MKEIFYTYNNEAIASCIFLSILRKVGSMDIPRSCLILPFLLDDRTVSYLKNNMQPEQTLAEVMKEEGRLFASFNKRYLALLPVTINALLLLHKGGQISIGKEILDKSKMDLTQVDFGNRFNSIQHAVPSLLSLTGHVSTAQLYKTLRIQL